MQTINVNTTPGNFMPSLHYSQGDIGRVFNIALASSDGYEIPVGATVEMVATKPSGFGFTVQGTLTDSVASFTTTETMTNEWGRFPAEIRISSNGDVIGTANFYLIGERDPHPEDTVDGDAATIIPQLTLLVGRVETAASSVLDMEVEAVTLPAGSQATYSYDEDENKATFGIPEGEAGAGSAGVVASAYSASKTYAVGDYAIHNSTLYRCTTAITTAEAFTAAHWAQVVLADDVSDLKDDSITSYQVDIRVDNYSQHFTDADNAPMNKIVFITGLITSEMVSHLPKYGVQGTLITFSYLSSAVNTKCQMYITDNNDVYTRVKISGIWSDWKSLSIENAIQSAGIELQSYNYSDYFTDADNAPMNRIVYVNASITSEMVTHIPEYGVAGTLITFSYLSSAVDTKCQMYITAKNVVYTRIKASGIWSDWKSLSIENAILKNDIIHLLKSNVIQINDDSDFSYDGYMFINASGELVDGNLPIALSDYIPVSYGDSYWVQVESILGTNYGPRNLRIHAYNDNKEWIKQLKAIALTITKDTERFSIVPDEDAIKYLRISVPVVITDALPADNTITKVSLFANNELFITGASDYLRYGLHAIPPSEGAFNAIKRARQLTDAKWTPIANLPRTMLNTGDNYLDSHGDSYEGQFVADKQYEGMPYSYTYGTPRYIGINESIDLFYSCLTDPNSALYANSAYWGNTAAYYGITCSTVVGYALNLPNIDSNYYYSIKGMNFLYNLITNGTRHDISDMQIGDVLVQTTHVAMIGDIISDGINVTDIEVLEGTRQGCTDQTVVSSELGGVARRFWMTVDEFFTWFDGFALYRYAYIDSIKFNRNPFVPLLYGEKSMPTRYFPCMPFYGNRKVFKSDINGNAVKILIHDTHYTHLLVYQNGVQYGSYEVTGLSSVDVNCEFGEAEYSAKLVTYDGENNINSVSVSCYWYTMPDYNFSITDDSENHNISVTVKKGNFKPWYVTFSSSATENNPDGFTIVSNYAESTSGDETTYTFSVEKGNSDSNTCIFALQSSKYAYFKLQKTY